MNETQGSAGAGDAEMRKAEQQLNFAVVGLSDIKQRADEIAADIVRAIDHCVAARQQEPVSEVAGDAEMRAESERTFEELLSRFVIALARRCNNPDDAKFLDEQTIVRAELVAHVAAIQAERDRLRKDSERLDFLNNRCWQIEWADEYEGDDRRVLCEIVGNGSDREWRERGLGKTLREAIDAAMTSEPKDASA